MPLTTSSFSVLTGSSMSSWRLRRLLDLLGLGLSLRLLDLFFNLRPTGLRLKASSLLLPGVAQAVPKGKAAPPGIPEENARKRVAPREAPPLSLFLSSGLWARGTPLSLSLSLSSLASTARASQWSFRRLAWERRQRRSGGRRRRSPCLCICLKVFELEVTLLCYQSFGRVGGLRELL